MEELIAHQVSLLQLREKRQQERAHALNAIRTYKVNFKATPFKPTAAQQRVLSEIHADLAREQPMMRLVQGDVARGKRLGGPAALAAIEQGHQVAIMAPTEILSEQHALTFEQWFAPWVLKLLGSVGAARARRVSARWSSLRAVEFS